jgi:pyrroline-5-carboxylate reductase
MTKYKIAILGGGNIGTSLAVGLTKTSMIDINEIIITDKRESRLQMLRDRGFQVTEDNISAVNAAGIIIISVKPQQFELLAGDIKGEINTRHIIISTVTGVTHKEIESFFGQVANVRIMPNIALEICESMTCISMANLRPDQEKFITSLFDHMGKSIVIPEDLMGAATVIGACGIAFSLRFMRAMSQGGIEIGFNSEVSQLISAQTIKGAAKLILDTFNHPEMEIDKVTTPQGITISGLNEMEHQGLSSAVIKGIVASFTKIENMSAK